MEQHLASKYGSPPRGWGPRLRQRYGYALPSDFYEACVSELVVDGCRWLDVGGGRNVFANNPSLATTLAARCSALVAVDPSANVLENQWATEKVQGAIEDYSGEPFDLLTTAMVVEHVERPESFCAALARLLKPDGTCVIFTVNRWSPISLASALFPFRWHHPVKRMLWRTEESDTFPAFYRMNTRGRLRSLFAAAGLKERSFARLDDLSVTARFPYLHGLELGAWKALSAIRLPYPESCLLGIYGH